MRVVGLSPLDKDATVALVEDGRLLFAAAEERFSRRKQHAGFPHRALAAAFAHAGWTARDVDTVAYPFLDAAAETRLMRECACAEDELQRRRPTRDPRPLLEAAAGRVPARSEPIQGLAHPAQRMTKAPLKAWAYRMLGAVPAVSRRVARHRTRAWLRAATDDHGRWQRELEQNLARTGLAGRLQRGEHHRAHAAAAYLASGLDRALVLTLDGYGSGLSGSVSLGEDGTIRRLHGLRFPFSLGSFYEAVTSSLGFHPDRHAGKVVGLAAYGDPGVLAEALLSRVDASGGELAMHETLNVFFARHVAERFPMVDVAAAWQHVLEHAACRIADHWLQRTGTDALVLSGGVTANVKMNQRLHELEAVKHVFVDPDMGDGGTAAGLARLLAWPGGPGEPLEHVYLGPGYGRAEMEEALAAARLPYTEPRSMPREVARRLHAGRVVARFAGRMEYGPRALGNRSILYHAREPAVNQWLNRRLGRTEFMPFAPVTRWEARHRCYHGLAGAEHAARFMTITFDCTDWMKSTCPAAVHVDGTARPQLVDRDSNPEYDDILAEYERLSDIPCLINTSFNMHEEPIVATPRDAVRAFLDGRIDDLALGPFLVEHPERRQHAG